MPAGSGIGRQLSRSGNGGADSGWTICRSRLLCGLPMSRCRIESLTETKSGNGILARGCGLKAAKPLATRTGEDPCDWLERHGDLLYRFALARVDDTHVAEDLVQETLLGAWRSREHFDGRSTLRTWLVGILRRKLADHFRKAGRETALLQASAVPDQIEIRLAPVLATDEFRAEVERGEFRDALRDCLGRLPAQLSEPLARRLAGEQPEAIAGDLGLTRNNLGVRLFRARLALRRCLELVWMGNRTPPE